MKFFTGVVYTCLGIVSAIVLGQAILAWTNPSDDPPTGAGVINSSGGNVGIGTTTLTALLNVGNTDGTVPTIVHFHGSINSPSEILVLTNKNAQNNSNNDFLHLRKELNSGIFSTADQGVGLRFQMENTAKILQTSGAIRSVLTTAGADNVAALTFSTQNGTNFNARLIIDGSGNVGIGTTNPLAQLDITDGGSHIEFKDDGTNAGISVIQTKWGTTPGTSKLVLNPLVGNVGIGTTAPGANLEIASAAQNTLRLKKTAGVAGSVDLFPAVGDATARTGTALCQTVVATAVCLGYWQSTGTASTCATSIANGRALCTDFGD
jgi:hypothetical protein